MTQITVVKARKDGGWSKMKIEGTEDWTERGGRAAFGRVVELKCEGFKASYCVIREVADA